jgi:hypothetical protein
MIATDAVFSSGGRGLGVNYPCLSSPSNLLNYYLFAILVLVYSPIANDITMLTTLRF